MLAARYLTVGADVGMCEHQGRVDNVVHAVWATIQRSLLPTHQREDDFETTSESSTAATGRRLS